MGLNILIGGVVVASLAAQTPQAETQKIVLQRQEAGSSPTFRLPQAEGAGSPATPATARPNGAFPRIAVPVPRMQPASLPSLDWDKGNAALKMGVVGLHLGWNF